MPLPQSATGSGRSLLRDQAYDMLFTAIQSGQLVPGEVLRDEELMDWLGMSRTPIRSALIRLAEYGLIEMSPGRQTRVTELSADRTNRALSVSAIFNEYAIRRVTGQLDAAQRYALGAARDNLRAAVASGDATGLARAISAAFRVLCDATGNPVLVRQVEHIDAELARFLQPGAASIDRAYMLASLDTVLNSVEAGDRDGALIAIRSLYAPTRENFLEHFREPELL